MRCHHLQKNTTSRIPLPSWLTSRRCIDRGDSESQVVHVKGRLYETNRPARSDRSALRYCFELLPLCDPQKCGLRTASRRSTWHCPSLRFFRLGERVGDRSRDDRCRAWIALLGYNQRYPPPIGGRAKATMDSRGNARAFSRANWLVVVLPLSWNFVSSGS